MLRSLIFQEINIGFKIIDILVLSASGKGHSEHWNWTLYSWLNQWELSVVVVFVHALKFCALFFVCMHADMYVKHKHWHSDTKSAGQPGYYMALAEQLEIYTVRTYQMFVVNYMNPFLHSAPALSSLLLYSFFLTRSMFL